MVIKELFLSFVYLSRLQHVPYLQSRQFEFSKSFLSYLIGPFQCEVLEPVWRPLTLVQWLGLPRGFHEAGKLGLPDPVGQRQYLNWFRLGQFGYGDWEHVLEGVNAMPSLKSSGRILLFWPFSLGFQWKFNTKKRTALIFISVLFHWCKSMQILEGHLSTETLPVYQPHIRRQR